MPLFTEDQRLFLFQAWQEIASLDLIFQIGIRSSKTDFIELVRDLEGENAEVYFSYSWKEFYSVDYFWEYCLNTLRPTSAYFLEKDHTIWINVHSLDQGVGGSNIYNLASNYAFNNNYIFIGDPEGLSTIAQTRRLENMISSAFKFGTTKHIEPHINQRTGNSDLLIPPLIWQTGDDFNNIIEMLLCSYLYIINTIPEVEQIRYNFFKDTFEDISNGREISDDDIQRIINAKPREGGESRPVQDDGRIQATTTAGSKTFKRAVLTGSLLRIERSERSHVLGTISSNEDKPRLRFILY